jgi:hypothetical protein
LFGIAFTPFASSAEERFAGFLFAVVLAIGSYTGGYILRQILELSGKLCQTIRMRCVRLLASLANEVLGRRVQTLEKCLVEQSRLLKDLRVELEITLNAEADLRSAIIEIDGHAKAATQNLIAEKAQLQAALKRVNGERARLAHELADLKRRQAEEPGQPSGSTMRRSRSAPTASPLKGFVERPTTAVAKNKFMKTYSITASGP